MRGFGLEIVHFDPEAFNPDPSRTKRDAPNSISREFSEIEREREVLVVHMFLGDQWGFCFIIDYCSSYGEMIPIIFIYFFSLILFLNYHFLSEKQGIGLMMMILLFPLFSYVVFLFVALELRCQFINYNALSPKAVR